MNSGNEIVYELSAGTPALLKEAYALGGAMVGQWIIKECNSLIDDTQKTTVTVRVTAS